MKTLKQFELGDIIPEGAKFVCEKKIEYGPIKEKVVRSGWIFETVRVYRDMKTVFVYEVDE